MPAQAQQTPADQNEQTTEIEQIVVTGSRIPRSGADTPTPMTMLNAEDIDLSGEQNVIDILNELPSIAVGLANNNSGNFTFGNAGINAINLRNLGANRTLVLIDGRRMTPSLLDNNVPVTDFSNVPAPLVERIEVITGGASAVYGADAVAGVVNVILKDNFEGALFQGQAGMSDRGDAERYSLSSTLGGNFAGDRGNGWLHFTYTKENGLMLKDRDFASSGLRYRSDPDNPNRLIAQEGLRALSFSANVPNFYLPVVVDPTTGQLRRSDINNGDLDPSLRDQRTLMTFNADGSLRPFELGPSGVIDGSLTDGGDDGALQVDSQLLVPLQRFMLAGKADYDLTDSLKYYISGKYALTKTRSVITPLFEIEGVNATITADNPYIQPDLAALLAGDPNDPTDDIPSFSLSRSDAEFGPRGSEITRHLFEIITGFEGRFGDSWNYELSYKYGESRNSNTFFNDRIDRRFFLAMDAVRDTNGNIVCRDQTAVSAEGCVPINLLGPTGFVNQEAVDFIKVDHTSTAVFQQQIVSGSLGGELVSLPAGPLGVATGFEYREDKLNADSSTEFEQGLGFFNSVLPDLSGTIEVYELFGEVRVPVLADLPFAQSLNLEGAVRWADYNYSGSNLSWKVGGDWTPVDDIRFRVNYARAVRAPNASELFRPASLGASALTDPCDALNVSANANRSANCAALGISQPFVSNSRVVTTLVSTVSNPNLDVEKATTLTLGTVIRPRWVPDLTLTVDYWDIQLDDAISSFSFQTVLNNCVDFDSLSNPFCELVTRGSDGNVSLVESSLINVASFKVRGVDLEATYMWDLDSVGLDGSLRFNGVATYLDRFQFIASAISDADENAGEHGLPKWRFTVNTTYDLADFTFNWQVRYLGSTVQNVTFDPATRDPFNTGAIWYTDIQARYDVNESMEVYAGINNVLDQAPPRHPDVYTGTNRPSSNVGGAAIYDVIGRFFYLGTSVKF